MRLPHDETNFGIGTLEGQPRGFARRGVGILPDEVTIARRDRSKGAAMVNGWTESRQRLEMLRHAVALVMLEAVAGIEEAQSRHEAIARHLGDDRCGCNRGYDGI